MTDALAAKVADPHAVLTGSVADHSEGMSYLETLPRRLVTIYLPLSIIMLVLLFPFYWMLLTSIKPDDQLLDMDKVSPFWTTAPTLKHFYNLLQDVSVKKAMYGRRPRCKGKIGHFSEAFGCSHVFGLFRFEDYLCRDAAAVAAGPDVIR